MAQRRIEYQGECFDISYERVNHTDSKQIATKPIILFLHGWGSNKDVMKIAFSKCFHQYEHIYIDMPGFGNSPNDKPLFTSDYAQIVQIFLRDVCGVSAQEVLMVTLAVRVPPSPWSTSQSMVMVRSPSFLISTAERRDRPTRR